MLEEIGRQFGGRHHSTVLHSINKVDQMCGADEALKRTIMRLMETCASQCPLPG
jgi:chromosomal replication initiator protein